MSTMFVNMRERERESVQRAIERKREPTSERKRWEFHERNCMVARWTCSDAVVRWARE